MKRLPGEFELIARLCDSLPISRRTILGPGDDCAILAPGRKPWLLTIDSMVEGVHFKLGWGPPEAFGERALTVNLSDVAAMGGVPTACVVNLAVRAGLGTTFFDRLYAGLRAAARRARVDIVGGNITRAESLAITVALLGQVQRVALRRDTARAGAEIFVTGTLGDAAAGWRILDRRLKVRESSARKFLVGRFLRPTARLSAGRKLAQMRPTPAAIDLSDGLLQDLGHILERSGVGAEIDPAAVPLSPAYREIVGNDPELAIGGGEDYELLFCCRPGHSEAALARRLGVPVHRIGRIVKGSRAVLLAGRLKSRPPVLRLKGWDQLRARA